MAEPSGYYVNRDACQQQSGRVQVAEIMKPGVRDLPGRRRGLLVVRLDHLGHQRSERLAPLADEDQATAISPRGTGSDSFLRLAAIIFSESCSIAGRRHYCRPWAASERTGPAA